MTTPFVFGGPLPMLSVTRAGVVVTVRAPPPRLWPEWYGGILRFKDSSLSPSLRQLDLFRAPSVHCVRYACVFCGTVFPFYQHVAPSRLAFIVDQHPLECPLRRDVVLTGDMSDLSADVVNRIFDPMVPIFPGRGQSIARQIGPFLARYSHHFTPKRVQSLFQLFEYSHPGSGLLTVEDIAERFDHLTRPIDDLDADSEPGRIYERPEQLRVIHNHGMSGVMREQRRREQVRHRSA